jgi:hypothetical protein
VADIIPIVKRYPDPLRPRHEQAVICCQLFCALCLVDLTNQNGIAGYPDRPRVLLAGALAGLLPRQRSQIGTVDFSAHSPLLFLVLRQTSTDFCIDYSGQSSSLSR